MPRFNLFGRLLSMLMLSVLLTATAAAADTAPYPPPQQARSDLAQALVLAGKEHKRVLVAFGANWCGDCLALDMNLKQASNQAILKADYVLVHVNVGRFDHNRTLAERFGIPLEKGIPALAVLDADGHVVYSQRNGEFESMSSSDPHLVTRFLEKWKG